MDSLGLSIRSCLLQIVLFPPFQSGLFLFFSFFFALYSFLFALLLSFLSFLFSRFPSRTSCKMLTRNGYSGHPCLVNVRGKTFSLLLGVISVLCVCVCCVFAFVLQIPFFRWRKFLSITSLSLGSLKDTGFSQILFLQLLR